MKEKRAALTVVLFAALYLIPGCSPEPIPLDSQEIQEYKGIDLTPAGSLRENSIKGIQTIDLEQYSLKVWGQVEQSLALSYEDVLSHTIYEKLVTLYCVEGWKAVIVWEGVLIKDILEKADLQEDAVTVIFHAQDGYTTSLPLDTILQKNILLAYKANGAILPERLGYPFIVVAEDRLGYKWARWVTEIEISGDPDYLGYWEQRGYSNEAGLD